METRFVLGPGAWKQGWHKLVGRSQRESCALSGLSSFIYIKLKKVEVIRAICSVPKKTRLAHIEEHPGFSVKEFFQKCSFIVFAQRFESFLSECSRGEGAASEAFQQSMALSNILSTMF